MSTKRAGSENRQTRPVFIVDGARTPFIKARGEPGPFTPVDLAVQCGRPLLLRQPIPFEAYDQVILGCVNVPAEEMNPARIAALRMGMGAQTTAFTVQINCGSGMQSIDTAYQAISTGNSDLVLAGGAEALSHAPLLFRQKAVEWFASLSKSKSKGEKLKILATANPKLFAPVIGLKRGLTDPVVDMNMGQTAEKLAHLFSISREQADEYAVMSHMRLHRAQKEGIFKKEMQPAFARDGTVYDFDDGVRANGSVKKLAELKPAFEAPYGQVTAGNSSQITDGASWLILASESAVKKHGLVPLAQIGGCEWGALDPSVMGLGPVISSTKLLQQHELSLEQIDLWEINEAFAAQVLACLKAWKDKDFCVSALGLEDALGELDTSILNIDGGAIGLGHPVGASGNRIVLHLVTALHHYKKQRGIATECIGGGQGGAMLIEKV